MTAVTATHRALEQYLRRATAGLPAAKRQEVWDELEEHVYCRAEQLQWQGITPEEAMRQALRELGPPLRVSAAMNGVHNMPKMIAFGVLGMLALSAGLYALAGGEQATFMSAQTVAPRKLCLPLNYPVPKLERLPSDKYEQCYSDNRVNIQGIFLDTNDAKRLLSALGMPSTRDKVFIRFSPLPEELKHQTSYSILDPKFKIGNRFFYDVTGVLPIAFESTANKLFIKEYRQPVFYNSESIELRFNTKDAEYSNWIYSSLSELAANFIYGFDSSKIQDTTEVVRSSGEARFLQTSLKEGEVVGLYKWSSSIPDPSPVLNKRYKHIIYFDFSPVDSKGRVSLRIPEKAAFTDKIPSHATSEYLLVRLTHTPLNDLKSGILLPQ